MTKSKLVELVISALPYAAQICELDIESEPNGIRFSWRGERFCVSTDLICQSDNSACAAILLDALLQRAERQMAAREVKP